LNCPDDWNYHYSQLFSQYQHSKHKVKPSFNVFLSMISLCKFNTDFTTHLFNSQKCIQSILAIRRG
jgi:hypothetical protein